MGFDSAIVVKGGQLLLHIRPAQARAFPRRCECSENHGHRTGQTGLARRSGGDYVYCFPGSTCTPLSRSELYTTLSELMLIAAAPIIGCKRPSIAIGTVTALYAHAQK